MVTYRAMLDVPRPVVEYLARLLAAHRRQLRTPKGARALGPFQQAILILRWFRDRSWVHCLARDAGVSQATGYRYLHEGIDVLAACAPDLHPVLAACRGRQLSHLVLDGTLSAATGSPAPPPTATTCGIPASTSSSAAPSSSWLPPRAPRCGSQTSNRARCTT